jgi:hypothetical protein
MANKVVAIDDCIIKVLDDCEVAGLLYIEGQLKRRIHNKGQGPTGPIGTYTSASYRTKRRNRGKQTSYVDLEFEGDLRKGYTTGKAGGKNVIGFTSDAQALKASQQIARYGNMFEVEKKIIDEAFESYMAVFVQKIKQCLPQ